MKEYWFRYLLIGVGVVWLANGLIAAARRDSKPAATYLPPVGTLAPPMAADYETLPDGKIRLTYTFPTPHAFDEWVNSGRGEGVCVKEAMQRDGLTFDDILRRVRTKVDE